MTTKEYDIDDTLFPKCCKCETTKDIVFENGETICIDCLFERPCEEDLAGEEWI